MTGSPGAGQPPAGALALKNTRWFGRVEPSGASIWSVVIDGLLMLNSVSTSATLSKSHGSPICVVAKSSLLPSSVGDVKVNVGMSPTVQEPAEYLTLAAVGTAPSGA